MQLTTAAGDVPVHLPGAIVHIQPPIYFRTKEACEIGSPFLGVDLKELEKKSGIFVKCVPTE